jgi:hypothetical protein
MCCGADADYRVPKTLLLQELDLGRGPQLATVVLGRALYGLSTSPRICLQTSFCAAHCHYWRKRFALLLGGLAGLFALLFVAMALVVVMITIAQSESRWPEGLAFLSLVGYLAAWIVTMQVVMARSIRVRGSLRGDIEIQNVAEDYVARCKADRKPGKRQRAAEVVELPSAVLAKPAPVADHFTGRPHRVPSRPDGDFDRPTASAERSADRPSVLPWLLILGFVIGVPVLVGMVMGVVLIFVAVSARKPTADGSTANVPILEAVPLDAVDAVKDDRPRTYLSDLNEINPLVGYGQFGKNGRLGYGIGGVADSPITVGGREFPKAISTAPPHFGAATVQYALGRRYREFRAWVAVNDLNDGQRTGPESHLTFKVVGDGKVLWTSAPVSRVETVQECRVNVQDVQTLELQVHCPGIMHYARAVWLQPYLVQ